MAMHGTDMSQISDWGDMVEPDVWYHVRIAKVTEDVSTTSGEGIVKMSLKIQDEPYVGRVIPDNPSLQTHALFKLKAYYKACEYFPGPEGHDPEQLLDRECFVRPSIRKLGGEDRYDIKPHHIKPFREGRPQK